MPITINGSGTLTGISVGGYPDGTVTTADCNFSPGKILQVVTATDATQRNTTSTSWNTASSGLIVSLTPAAASSKIFVIAASTFGSSLSANQGCATIQRDIGGTIVNMGAATNGIQNEYSDSGTQRVPLCMTVLDDISSVWTSGSLSYQVYIRRTGGSGLVDLTWNSTTGRITAFEIGA